jgi:hypothetical protein
LKSEGGLAPTISPKEGEHIGKAKVLLELISLKFGAPSETVVKRVTDADIAQWDVWMRRILTANSLREWKCHINLLVESIISCFSKILIFVIFAA